MEIFSQELTGQMEFLCFGNRHVFLVISFKKYFENRKSFHENRRTFLSHFGVPMAESGSRVSPRDSTMLAQQSFVVCS